MQDCKPSGSSLEKDFTKPEGQNRIKLFHCKQQGRQSFECPKCINHLENDGDVNDTPDDPKENKSKIEELEIIGLYDVETLMVLKETTNC